YPDALHPSDSCLVKTIDQASSETDYACDQLGDITSTTVVVPVQDTQPAQSRTTTTVYDNLGRVKKVVYPDSTYLQNIYDSAGWLTSVRDPASQITNYIPDARGNVITKTLPDPDGNGPLTSPVFTYQYDDLNDQTQMKDPVGQSTTKVSTWT